MKEIKDTQNKKSEKLVKRAYMTMMAKALLRNGNIDNSTFNVMMSKIEKATI